MKNKGIVLEAIDNYSLFNKNQKNILKALVNLSIDGEVITSIADLSQITNLVRATISSALSFLEKNEIIEVIRSRGIVFTGCKINQQKLNEIIIRYQTKKSLLTD